MRNRYQFHIAAVVVLASLIGFFQFCSATADYSALGGGKACQVITVTTSAVTKITLSGDTYQLIHLNIQNDGSTASASTDAVYVMPMQDSSGNAISMAASLADGFKLPVFAGGQGPIIASDIPDGPDGRHEIQIKASGHGAKVLLVRMQ